MPGRRLAEAARPRKGSADQAIGDERTMATGVPMIEAEGLTKNFGAFTAVRDLNFRVRAGEVFGFLGPNGAGKSTTMRLLTGFLSPSAGLARVAGLDVASERIAAAARIGYLPENGPLYTDMTPEDMLDFFGRMRGIPRKARKERVDAMIGLCGLEEVVGRRISKLSRGYRQRVGLANALLHEPDVLILDEPTNGLDPNQIQQVRATLRRIGKKKTILLSTHLLQEVEAMATRVLMVSEGTLVFDGTPDELESMGGQRGMEGAFRSLTQSNTRTRTVK